jgi:hypothetical protein
MGRKGASVFSACPDLLTAWKTPGSTMELFVANPGGIDIGKIANFVVSYHIDDR